MFYEVDTETLNTHQSWISFFFQNVFLKFSQIITPPPKNKKQKKEQKNTVLGKLYTKTLPRPVL